MKKKPTLTISLLTWNGAEYLPWLLKSLQEQTFRNWELLVLDNASADRSVATVQEFCPRAKIIQQKQNIGFARGHNLLVNWSSSEYVFVVNQDIILEKNYLDNLVTFLEKNKEAASAAGKIMYWDFASGQTTDKVDSFGLKINRQREVIDAEQGKKDFSLDNQEVFGLSCAAVVFRRKALDSVGIYQTDNYCQYFDEDFFAYKEDIDLAWRLRLAGWQNWLITATKAYHHRSVSGQGGLRQRRQNRPLANKLSYRNHLMMLYKNSFWSYTAADFWLILWYEFKKFMYLIIFEPRTLVGWKEFFQLWPKLRAKKKVTRQLLRVSPAEIKKWFSA